MAITLKKYKIRNIDREVCCVEQMLAYNYASFYKSLILKDLEKCTEKWHETEVFYGYRNHALNYFREQYPDMRYNPDALQVALDNGLKKYVRTNFFIAKEYEEVGKMFPIPYKDPRS